MNLRIVLEPGDEGGYTVYAPGLPGCIGQGDTMKRAAWFVGRRSIAKWWISSVLPFNSTPDHESVVFGTQNRIDASRLRGQLLLPEVPGDELRNARIDPYLLA